MLVWWGDHREAGPHCVGFICWRASERLTWSLKRTIGTGGDLEQNCARGEWHVLDEFILSNTPYLPHSPTALCRGLLERSVCRANSHFLECPFWSRRTCLTHVWKGYSLVIGPEMGPHRALGFHNLLDLELVKFGQRHLGVSTICPVAQLPCWNVIGCLETLFFFLARLIPSCPLGEDLLPPGNDFPR